MKRVIASWSGGKDSCLATYMAIQKGFHVAYIANTISQDYKRVRFHGVQAEIIQAQSLAIGIPLLQQETTHRNYEREFIKNLQKAGTVDGVVFGDIHLEDCLRWAKKVTGKLRVKAIEPLWHIPQEKILAEFIDAGFEAILVSTQGNILGKEWIGRKIDGEFLNDIKHVPHIDACGENGEYHTLVTSGPLFKKKLSITKSEPVFRNGYWFLDIREYQLE